MNGVHWNTKGTAIVLTHPDYTAEQLMTYASHITPILFDKHAPSISVRCDTEWTSVVLHGVHTGIDPASSDPATPHTPAQIADEIVKNNPDAQHLQFAREPRWLCNTDRISSKTHTSVVLTLSSREQADFLLRKLRGLSVFGQFARAAEYIKKDDRGKAKPPDSSQDMVTT